MFVSVEVVEACRTMLVDPELRVDGSLALSLPWQGGQATQPTTLQKAGRANAHLVHAIVCGKRRGDLDPAGRVLRALRRGKFREPWASTKGWQTPNPYQVPRTSPCASPAVPHVEKMENSGFLKLCGVADCGPDGRTRCFEDSRDGSSQ